MPCHLSAGAREAVDKSGDNIAPVVEQLRAMHTKGRGVIAMKLVGDGAFVNPEDREQAARFVMSHSEINAAVIGSSGAAASFSAAADLTSAAAVAL